MSSNPKATLDEVAKLLGADAENPDALHTALDSLIASASSDNDGGDGSPQAADLVPAAFRKPVTLAPLNPRAVQRARRLIR